MKLSALVTFYNQAQYVDEAMNSLVSQKTDFDFEILVGDDGSTDDTVARLESWRARYPDLIQIHVMDREPGRKYNSIRRASANRLNLIKRAKGEYFTLLDGDDYYTDPEKFQLQAEILDRPENQDCIGCAHDVMAHLEEDDRIVPYNNNRLAGGKIDAWQYWAKSKYFHVNTIMFRNIFKDGLPEDCPLWYFNDNTLTLYMLKFGTLYYLPRVMGHYRLNQNSIWVPLDKTTKLLTMLIKCDTLRRVNPAFKNATLKRYFWVVKESYKRRNELADEKYDSFRAQAAEEEASEALRWLNHGKSPLSQRLGNHLNYFKSRLIKSVMQIPGVRL